MTSPSGYDFWLLDLDGTIVDVEESYVHSVFDEVGRRLGTEFTDREAEILWHGLRGSRNEQLRRMDVDVDRFWSVFHEVEDARKRAEATYVHEDARMLTELDVPTAVVTHCQSYLTESVLEYLDLGDWFDAVVCCDEDLGWKPDPTPVEYAIDRLGVSGTNGVLIGDSPCDVGAAWNAGLDAVHVERHDPVRRGQCVLADYRVDALTALRSIESGAAAD